jgi:hypothetical protein
MGEDRGGGLTFPLERNRLPFSNFDEGQMKLISIAAAASLLLGAPIGAKTHLNKSAAKQTDWSDTLAKVTFLNRDDPNSALYSACARSNFAALASALYSARHHISREKSEYETDADFAAFRHKAEDALNGANLLVVCQPLDGNDDVPFTYDADTQTFQGEFIANQNVWREYKRTGSYVGQTAMGARAKVTTAVELEYNVNLKWDDAAADNLCQQYGREPGCHITFENTPDPRGSQCISNDMGTYRFKVPISRDQAPLLKSKGYLAFVGRLKYPFITDVGLDGDPTITDPRDIYKMMFVVDFEPEQVAVVGPSGMPWTCSLGTHSPEDQPKQPPATAPRSSGG